MTAEAVLPLSGRPLRIRSGHYQAEVTSVGASLRSLRWDGRDLIVPFEGALPRPSYSGATLAPWPNRIVDGRYTFAGVDHELPLTEPARHHALHGLVLWSEFADRAIDTDRVLLSTVIEPRHGYPFRIEVEVEYRLDAEGLHHTVTGRNLGLDPAPWGCAPHPYLTPGHGSIHEWTLTLQADSLLTVTPDRLCPLTVAPVDDHPRLDFRATRPLGDADIDHAYTDLTFVEGFASAEVRAPDGAGTRMRWDRGSPWVQVYTAADPRTTGLSGAGIAIEPMTCAPDAFNASRYPFNTGLIVLRAGESATTTSALSALN